MLKRAVDVLISLILLILTLPITIPVMILVWRQDGHSPFYIAPRVGKGGKLFHMVKLRSMVKNADKSGVDSTGSNDMRITPVGHFIRRFKLDELTQMWNVFLGDMSLVGPRPNVKRETDLYTSVERRLLLVKPGITDFSSIVFSDEGDILKDKPDPDVAYNQLIRPGKGYLGLFYIDNQSFFLDLQLIALTAIAIFSKKRALNGIVRILRGLEADEWLIKLAQRETPLTARMAPGAVRIVSFRDEDVSI
ncbi:sugar transferase [bacterium]|nr:sugar transferase [bacterium]